MPVWGKALSRVDGRRSGRHRRGAAKGVRRRRGHTRAGRARDARLEARAERAPKPADAATKLKDAVKLLNEGDMTKNPLGRAIGVRQDAVMWMAQPAW